MKQTEPHATIRLQRFQFAPPLPSKFESGVSYKFNVNFMNSGSEAARNLNTLVKIYVGKPDDEIAEKKMAAEFEKTWSDGKRSSVSPVMNPNDSSFQTTERTFQEEEFADLPHDFTIYYLVRFQWADETGQWRTDACGNFQRVPNEQMNIAVSHPCVAFSRFRYKVGSPPDIPYGTNRSQIR